MESSLPQPLFGLLCISICNSALAIVFAALVINISPALWIIPAAFITSFAYHASFFLVANSEGPDSPRLFSKINDACTCLLVIIWAATTSVATAYTVKFWTRQLQVSEGRGWALILASVISFLQLIVVGCIAILARKAGKKIQYKEKWKWRKATGADQWGIGGHPGPSPAF